MLTNMELAKAKLALHSPEFISLTSKLEFIKAPPEAKLPDGSPFTAGTDGRRLIYNEEWVNNQLTLRQCIGLVLHEIMHNMLAHPARCGSRNKIAANVAMDIVGNSLLQEYFAENKALNAELPPGGLFGSQFDKYKGWNWERVYADLMDGATKMPKMFDGVEPAKNEDGTPMTAQEADNLAKEWTMAAQQAATMAKARGVQSGFFESFVSGLTKTKVDWRSQVLDEFTKVAKDDQSYRRFNRKLMHAEVYLPGMYSEHIGHVGFFVDTSGSMEDASFKLALSGMNEIMADLKPDRIVFGCCDTRMTSVEELTPDDLPVTTKAFKGRGGTVLTPIFEHIAKMNEPLELVVVLTDGQFESGISQNLKPDCPVVWLVTTDSTEAALSAFGKVIRVEV